MKWMVGLDELDVVQRRTIDTIVSHLKSNHWVKGFAGSGKTIVLTHVLKRLLAEQKTLKVCFATYTHALVGMVESGLTAQEAKQIEITTLTSVKKLRGTYDVIVVDEMQDISKQQLEVILKKATILVIAADHDQRIYRFSVKEAELAKAIKPVENHQLRNIHRINKPVFEVATTIFADAHFDYRGIPDDDYEKIRVYAGSSLKEEFETIHDEAVRISGPGQPSAILFPANADMTQFMQTIADTNKWGTVPAIRQEEEMDDPFGQANDFLARKGSPLLLYGSTSGQLPSSNKKKVVYLMTYFNAKGLEFPYVFLPKLTEKAKISPMGGASDDEARRLFFVAATRAKERLHLSYHGAPHQFVEEIQDTNDDVLEPLTKKRRNY